MKDEICIHFLQWVLPQMQLRWQGFRRVRKQVCKRIGQRIDQLGLVDELAYRDYLLNHVSEWHNLHTSNISIFHLVVAAEHIIGVLIHFQVG